ncbi:MAG: GTPase HflX [Snowella sp.]|nr:GTPase HflX [Snowella sp.]
MYHQRLPGDRFTTPEFAQRLAAISTEIGQPISAYINRRGQVIRVGVGTPRQTQIPPLELPRYGAERLSGIRCLTTSLKPDPPKESSLTAMVLQRLDALVSLVLTGEGFERRGGGATGYIKAVYLAHLLPQPELPEVVSYWQVSDPLNLDTLCQEDALEFVENLEAEFRREFVARQVEADQDRVLLVGLQTDNLSDQVFEDGLAELTRLVDTAGGQVLEILRQKRSQPHPQTVIGSGKVEELALKVQTTGANLVAFDRDLSASQIRNLETQLGTRVIDRTEVILDIFAQRAQSQEGKLQVELAQLEYMMPRLTGRGQAMSRLGGGIGTRGPGETKLETERRAIQRRISKLQQDVNQLQSHRARLRKQRQKQEIPNIAIVGYTNAGKSTLINALTQAEVYTADQLFATLDPTTRQLRVADQSQTRSQLFLLTDTVGFIHELPPSLVDAFRATLEEVTEADALLQVVDLSHPAWQRQLESVNTILEEMPITTGPMLIAFNKIDQVSSEALATAKQDYPHAVFISACQRFGLETLKQRLTTLVN